MLNHNYKRLSPEEIKNLQNDKRESYFEMQRLLDKLTANNGKTHANKK